MHYNIIVVTIVARSTGSHKAHNRIDFNTFLWKSTAKINTSKTNLKNMKILTKFTMTKNQERQKTRKTRKGEHMDNILQKKGINVQEIKMLTKSLYTLYTDNSHKASLSAYIQKSRNNYKNKINGKHKRYTRRQRNNKT